jgi:hypothetical protein
VDGGHLPAMADKELTKRFVLLFFDTELLFHSSVWTVAYFQDVYSVVFAICWGRVYALGNICVYGTFYKENVRAKRSVMGVRVG